MRHEEIIEKISLGIMIMLYLYIGYKVLLIIGIM
jgi:hypothetical protein